MVSKGSNDNAFELDMEWLFFKQEMGAGFSAQLGRIRFPAFIDSEVVYIGNTYPTVAPPAEIYSVLPINHIDGASLSQTSTVGDWTLETKAVLWGNSEEDFEGYTLRLHRIHGLSFSANYNYLTMRIADFKAEERIEIVDPIYAADFGDKLNYIIGALRYDDERFYVSTEGIIINSDNDLIDEDRNWNVTTGMYAGPVLIYVGHSRNRVTNSKDMSEALTEELGSMDMSAQYGLPTGSIMVPKGVIYSPFMTRHQNSNTAGIKYNITGNTVLKAQVQYVYALDKTQGNFNTATAKVPFESMYIYDVAIQSTF